LPLSSKLSGLLSIRQEASSRVFGLDVMRAIAITAVLIAHSRGLLAPLGIDLEFLKFSAFAGVEIFFVLSGFLIGTILIKSVSEEEQFGFARLKIFWVRRWFRTLPNYFLVLSVLLVLHKIIHEPASFEWSYLLFLQNFVTPHPNFFGEAWSLAVEEWFYLLFPLAVWITGLAGKKSGSKHRLLSVIAAFILFFNVFRFIYYLEIVPEWDLGIRRIVMCRLDSIMYGVLGAWLAFYFPDKWERNKKIALVAGSMLLLICTIYFFIDLLPSSLKQGSVFSGTLLFTGFSIAFACFLPVLSTYKKAQLSRAGYVITHISIVSYSIYLLHFSLIFKTFKLLPAAHSAMQAIGMYLLYWLVVLVAATVNYNLFEKPMTGLRNKFAAKKHS